MMKNLPNRYKEVLRKISNMRGFVGLVDETTLGDDGVLYGTLRIVYEDHDIVDKGMYIELEEELSKCGGDDDFYDPCNVYPTTIIGVHPEDNFVTKEDLIKEIGE